MKLKNSLIFISLILLASCTIQFPTIQPISSSFNNTSIHYNSSDTKEIIDIYEIRTGDYINRNVTTIGTITRILSNNTLYIQNANNAITIYSKNGFTEDYIIGNKVQVTGIVNDYFGRLSIGDNENCPTVSLVSQVGDTINPLLINKDNFDSIFTKENEGKLICIEDGINPKELKVSESGNQTLSFVYDNKTISCYINAFIDSSIRESINDEIEKINSSYLGYVGILGIYNDNVQIQPTQIGDLFAANVIDVDESPSITLNYSTYSINNSYSTGNYGSKSCGGYTFEYYRAVELNNYITLLPYVSSNGDGSSPGAIYNVERISKIKKIEISYYTEYSFGDNPKLLYGLNYDKNNIRELSSSTSLKSIVVNTIDARFFKIETGNSKLFIKSINIYTDKFNESYSISFNGCGENEYRINPNTYNSQLIDGESSVEVPTKIQVNGDSYSILESKIYTYYSYSYIEKNPSFADEASMIDPVDVANYYIIFKEFPANYVIKSDYYSAYSLFGDDTRCVSTYTRTDGYAKSVPYQNQPGSSKPIYHELDIGLLTSYSSNNRGVGRIVVWQYGFTCSEYNDSPVAVYTDDHYATFSEFLNTGNFGKRFNAEMYYTSYNHSPAKTLN